MALTKHITIISLAALLAACGDDSGSSANNGSQSSSDDSNPIVSQPIDGVDSDNDGIPDSEDADDDNDGTPDSEDNDDDGDGVLDQDDIEVDPSTSTCEVKGSLSSFNIVATSSNSASGETNAFGRVMFEWSAATSSDEGDITYAVCRESDQGKCINLGQTKETSLEVKTGGAFKSADDDFFILAQQNGSQSCSDSIELEEDTINNMIGKVALSGHLNKEFGGAFTQFDLSTNGKTLMVGVSEAESTGRELFGFYERNGDTWNYVNAPENSAFRATNDLYANSKTVISTGFDECYGECFSSYRFSNAEGWKELTFKNPMKPEIDVDPSLLLDEAHVNYSHTLSSNGQYMYMSFLHYYSWLDLSIEQSVDENLDRLAVLRLENGQWVELSHVDGLYSAVEVNENNSMLIGVKKASSGSASELIDVFNIKNKALEKISTIVASEAIDSTASFSEDIQLSSDGNTFVVRDGENWKNAYVFKKQDGNWVYTQTLNVPTVRDIDVANNGSTIVISSTSDMTESGVIEGDYVDPTATTSMNKSASYVYKIDNGAYELESVLKVHGQARAAALDGVNDNVITGSSQSEAEGSYYINGYLRTY
ncbi:hypothetical protein N9R79_05280 [Vibrio sp.]|nr:hypothetical protein [Vibrio sp.]